MTGLARRAQRWIARSLLPDDEGRRVAMQLVAPRHLIERGGAELDETLSLAVRELQEGVGLHADVDVDIAASSGAAEMLAVSVEGRPVALLECPGQGPSRGAAEPIARDVARRMVRRLPLLHDAAAPRSSPAVYLLSIGRAVPAEPTEGGVAEAERLVGARERRPIAVEVPVETLRRIGDSRDAVVRLREEEFRKRGIRYPDVRVDIVDREPGIIRTRLHDVTFPVVELGPDAGWAEVVDHLAEVITERRAWFVHPADVRQTLDGELSSLYPDLVRTTRENYSVEQLTACLRELVRSGRRLRNLPRILWLLLEQGGRGAGEDVLRLAESPLLPRSRNQPTAENDPVVLAGRIRKMAAEESWRLGTWRLRGEPVRLDLALERRLASGHPDPDAEWEAVRTVAAASPDVRLVARSIAAVHLMRDVVQALDRPPPVMASQELPPDFDIDRLRVLSGVSQG